jgi:hypothetical protein
MANAGTKIEDYGFLSDTQTGALVSRDFLPAKKSKSCGGDIAATR